jgi:hypothetical protein
MHQKLELLEGWQSAGVGLSDEKHVVHSSWAVAQLDELPAVGDGTLDIRDAVSKSWDTTLETRNTGSGTADVGLASVHDSKIGF